MAPPCDYAPKSIIREYRASGMSVKSWCKANGIAEQTYYKNLKKLQAMVIICLGGAAVEVIEAYHSRQFRWCIWHCKIYVRQYHCL